MKNTTPKMKIIPRGAWVLVKPVPKKNTNDQGLSIPDSVEKEQKAQGEVIAVGPKVDGLKKGQTVIYGIYAGEDIQLGSQLELKDKIDFKLILDEDILAILEK